MRGFKKKKNCDRGNQCSNKHSGRKKIKPTYTKRDEDGEKEEKDETEKYGGQEKGRKIKLLTKCYFYENTKCMKEDCKFSHPEIECEDLKKNSCDRGNQCSMKHSSRKRIKLTYTRNRKN